jgi:hypothetical protein
MSGQYATKKSEVAISTRVISGSWILKLAKILANAGITKRFTTNIAAASASITITG